LGGAADDVDGLVFEEFLAEPLGHTADDADDQIGPALFDVLEMAKLREDALLGVLADGAGIYQDNVGFLDVICQREACLHKARTDQGGIELIHLTPKGLDN
jgi:hypothetical protein